MPPGAPARGRRGDAARPGQRPGWLALLSPSHQPGYRSNARRLPVHAGPPRRVPGRHAGQDRPVAGAQHVRAMREPLVRNVPAYSVGKASFTQIPVTGRSGQFLCRDEFQTAIEGGRKALQR